LIKKFILHLSKEFDMKNLGQMHYCLSIEIWRENGNTLITQIKYAHEIIKKYSMYECRPISIPLEQNDKLYVDDGG